MAKDIHPKAPRIGIIGGGQLGRMMALDAHRLGLEVHVYEPEPESPAGQVAHQVRGSFDDVAALTAFGRTVDVVTYEREQLPAAPIAELARTVPVHPSPEALAKLRMLRSFDPRAPRNAAVPDPYYGGERGFDEVLDMCEAACRGLLEHIQREQKL